MFFLENFVGFNVFYVNCRDLSLQVWLKSFQLVIDGEKEKLAYNLVDCMRALSLAFLLRLLFLFFSDSPIQQAFAFFVQLNTEAYHLSLVCLERFQVAVI